MHQISLEKFEGPLDLLLQLIEKNKLQITEISLAEITEQYLEYINNSEALNSSEVADFLLTASKLIYLKSKYLLPDFNLTDEDEAGSLEHQLKIYKQYYEASYKINKLFRSKRRFSYSRTVFYKRAMVQEFIPPSNVTKNILAQTFKEILSRIDNVLNLPAMIIAKAVSINEKIKHLRDLIKNSPQLNFTTLMKDQSNKMEIVVSFLAMLELVKQREVIVLQDKLFGDLNIHREK